MGSSRYQDLKAQGRCPRCGATAEGGYTLCVGCREQAAQYARDHKDKIYPAQYARIKQRSYARKMAGVCPMCGGERQDGYVMCTSCRDKYSGYQRKFREKKKKSETAEKTLTKNADSDKS